MRNEATIVLGQRKLLQRLGPGLIHAFIFWGFLVLLPTILIALIGVVDKHATLPWLGHQGWFAFLVDIFAMLVLIGCVAAAVDPQGPAARALRGQPPRRGRPDPGADRDDRDDAAAMARVPDRARAQRVAAVVGAGLGRAVAPVRPRRGDAGARARVRLDRTCCTILAFLAYLPRSKHLHILSAAFNVWFGRTGPGGRLEPLRFDDPDVPEDEIRFGAGTAADLTFKQVLDTFSCTECGRCQDACPAFATGKMLSPKLVIMGLRDQVFAERRLDERAALRAEPLVPAPSEESVWDCVTCGACVQACPVSIEHVDHIVDLRRHLVMVESSFPTEAEPMLRDVERASNPWGKPQSERADWAAELGVRVLEPGDPAPEYLYWVGCAASFDERARTDRRVDRASCCRRPGVDFAILGPREAAPATRPGGWATSTCSRRSPSRTSRRSTRPA